MPDASTPEPNATAADYVLPSGDIPSNPDWANPPEMIISGFIYSASNLALHYIAMLNNGAADKDTMIQVQQRLERILADIKRELKECPEKADDPTPNAVCCSSCLTTYNTCVRNGGTVAFCMNNYNKCMGSCNPLC